MSVLSNLEILKSKISAAEKTHYDREGYVILKNVIDKDLAARLHDGVLELFHHLAKNDSYLTQNSQCFQNSELHEFIDHPEICSLAAQLMGGASSLYLPFSAVKGAKQGEFGFHQDNQYTLHEGHSCNIWFAFMDIPPEHGSLRMVPRSHESGTLEYKKIHDDTYRGVIDKPEHWVDIGLEAGDAVAFTRLTVHGSGPNDQDTPRVGYALQYHRNDTKALIDGQWEYLSKRPRWERNYLQKN